MDTDDKKNTGNQTQISKGLLALNAFLVVFVVSMIVIISNTIHTSTQHIQKTAEAPTAAQSHFTEVFTNLPVEAKAVYVYDMRENKVLFEKNSRAQLPLASLTKLMMAMVASNLVPKNSHVTIRKEFLGEEGDNGLVTGERWALKDLLDFSLVVSSNDGARSIASVIGAYNLHTNNFDMGRKDFIAKMNSTAHTLGLSQMYFVNENGLDLNSTSGGYGSAENVSQLLQYMLTHKNDILEATKYAHTKYSSTIANHTAQNTDILAGKIPGLLASKTGYTNLAGGNLAVAFDAGLQHPIIIVVLGSSKDGRFTDVLKLVKASRKYVQSGE